jgi:DNA-binding transcriptional regulator YhcF (GntR family)
MDTEVTGGAAFELDSLAIDRDAEVPIGVQLAWALRSRIADGRFKPGQRLPGLRDLAEDIGVNVNTVRAVYQRLEGEGLIDSQQGVGTFVSSNRRGASPVGTIAADAAREAQANGVDPRAVAAALYVTSEPGRAASLDGAVAHRRDLRAQIATLERAIVVIEANYPGVVPPADEPQPASGPALLTAAELERVRTLLVRRLATVQAAIDALPHEPTRSDAEDRSQRERTATERDPARRPARRRAANRPATAET